MATGLETTTLACTGCGANLAFAEGQERAVCSFCGAQSVLVAEQTGERPTARIVAAHPPAFFEAALAAAEPDALAALCARYVDNVNAYSESGQAPDEEMMRAVEKAIDIPEEGKAQFRRSILDYIGALKIEGRQFEYRTSEKFHRALAACLYLQSSASD